jgi:hypothetical protein
MNKNTKETESPFKNINVKTTIRTIQKGAEKLTDTISSFSDDLSKSMNKAFEGMDEAFKAMDNVFDDPTSSTVSDEIEVYASSKEECLKECNQHTAKGYKLVSIMPESKTGIELWTARMKRELKVSCKTDSAKGS